MCHPLDVITHPQAEFRKIALLFKFFGVKLSLHIKNFSKGPCPSTIYPSTSQTRNHTMDVHIKLNNQRINN